MKSLFNLMSKLGHAGLSTMQAVGLSAAVGVAGVAAWQMLAPAAADSSTAFTAPMQQENVVYVAGASGGNYGANAEAQSAFQAAPSKAIEMQQREAQNQALVQSVIDNPDASVQMNVESYKMSGSEGLGMGQNEASAEAILGTGALAGGMTAQTSGMAGAIAQAQAQAQAQAAAGGADGALASAGHSGANRGMATANGNVFNSAYVQQADGLGNARGSESGASATLAGTAGGAGVGNIPGVSLEGKTIRSQAGFGANRDGVVGSGRSSAAGNNLTEMSKRSAEIAGNKNRSANEGSKIFLASTTNSGGISLADGATASTGQGATSSDFDMNSQLAGAAGIAAAIAPGEELFKAERTKLRKQFWGLVAKIAAMAIVYWLVAWIPGVGRKYKKRMDKQIQNFRDKAAAYEEKYGTRSATGKQLDWMARSWVKKASRLGPFALGTLLVAMPWAFFKKFNVTTKKDDDDASALNTTPTQGGEVDGTALDLNPTEPKQ